MGLFGPSPAGHDALRTGVHRLESARAASLPAEARLLKQQGRTIEAVTVAREHPGLGLREAKDLVDRLEG